MTENIVTDNGKPEPFHKLMSSQLRQMYELKLLDAPAYILLIVQCHGAAGWKWTFNVKEFCKKWGISKTTFYRAISKLKTMGLLHWEVEGSITVWHGTDIARGNPSPTGGNPSPTGGNPSPTGGNPSPTGGNPSPTGGIKSRRKPAPEPISKTLRSSQIFSDHSEDRKTLSAEEKERLDEALIAGKKAEYFKILYADEDSQS